MVLSAAIFMCVKKKTQCSKSKEVERNEPLSIWSIHNVILYISNIDNELWISELNFLTFKQVDLKILKTKTSCWFIDISEAFTSYFFLKRKYFLFQWTFLLGIKFKKKNVEVTINRTFE